MRLFFIIAIISLFVLAGCQTQTLPEDTAEDSSNIVEVSEGIVKPCPASCDDDNADTVDTCGEETGYECSNRLKDSLELAEDIIRGMNDKLNKKYVYVSEQKGKVTRLTAQMDKDAEQIVIDALDEPLADEVAREAYIRSNYKGEFMDPVRAERSEFKEDVETRDYYYEGKGYYDYVDHALASTGYFDEVNFLDVGYESLFAAVDVYSINLLRHKNDMDYKEEKFFLRIPFVYRLSIVCKPNVIVHLYPEPSEYYIEDSATYMRTQETSYLINHHREIKEKMMKKAERFLEICD